MKRPLYILKLFFIMRNFFILIFFNNYSKNLLIFKKLIFLKIYIFQDVCFLNNNNNIFFF